MLPDYINEMESCVIYLLVGVICLCIQTADNFLVPTTATSGHTDPAILDLQRNLSALRRDIERKMSALVQNEAAREIALNHTIEAQRHQIDNLVKLQQEMLTNMSASQQRHETLLAEQNRTIFTQQHVISQLEQTMRYNVTVLESRGLDNERKLRELEGQQQNSTDIQKMVGPDILQGRLTNFTATLVEYQRIILMQNQTLTDHEEKIEELENRMMQNCSCSNETMQGTLKYK